MQFLVSFVATLACALAAPSAYSPYPYAAPAYAGAYAHAPADIKVLPSGFLADTPEVAHAKSAHLAEKAKVASQSAYYAPAAYAAPSAYAAPASYAAPATYVAPYYARAYTQAPADIKVLPSGFLADTPEVAHAKSAHLAEKAKVASQSAYYAPAAYAAPATYAAPASYATPAVYAAPAAYAAPAYASYAAPAAYVAPYYAGAYAHAPADIKVLPSGYLADTPEVAHAKATHFAEKAKSAAAAAASPDHGSYPYAAPAYYSGHY